MMRLLPAVLPAALPAAALLVLSACVVPIPVPEGTPGAIQVIPGDSCGARGLRQLIGQDGAGVAGLRVVGADGAPVPIRVIGPDDVVTMDFSPTRVNVRTDAQGTITAVDCG